MINLQNIINSLSVSATMAINLQKLEYAFCMYKTPIYSQIITLNYKQSIETSISEKLL